MVKGRWLMGGGGGEVVGGEVVEGEVVGGGELG